MRLIKSKKHLSHLAVLLSLLMLVVALVSGCTQSKENTSRKQESTSSGKESGLFEIRDMTGREVKLDKAAERIVVLSPSDCEILFAIGAGEKVVGRGEYCDYPEEVLNIPSVQSGAETNLEQIIALNPQLVIMTKMAQSKEQVEILENAGIKVVVTDAQDIEGVYTAIELIGTVTGMKAEAEAVINRMKSTIADISAKVKEKGSEYSTKTVYFEASPLQYGLWTTGKGTFIDELIAILGLNNAFSDIEGWSEISQEQVIERNPDYILTTTMYSTVEGLTPIEEIMGRKGWENIKAIRAHNVINIDPNEVSRPGPRLTDVLTKLYSFIYEDKITENK